MTEVLDELRAAFEPAPLRARGVFDMYTDASLCERALDGRRWDEVDPRTLANRSDALQFLDHERLVAWLPIYLRLFALEPSQVAVLDTLTAILLRPEAGDERRGWRARRRRFESLTAALSDPQKRVIAHCLRAFVAAHPGWAGEAQLALDRYWGAFG